MRDRPGQCGVGPRRGAPAPRLLHSMREKRISEVEEKERVGALAQRQAPVLALVLEVVLAPGMAPVLLPLRHGPHLLALTTRALAGTQGLMMNLLRRRTRRHFAEFWTPGDKLLPLLSPVPVASSGAGATRPRRPSLQPPVGQWPHQPQRATRASTRSSWKRGARAAANRTLSAAKLHREAGRSLLVAACKLCKTESLSLFAQRPTKVQFKKMPWGVSGPAPQNRISESARIEAP